MARGFRRSPTAYQRQHRRHKYQGPRGLLFLVSDAPLKGSFSSNGPSVISRWALQSITLGTCPPEQGSPHRRFPLSCHTPVALEFLPPATLSRSSSAVHYSLEFLPPSVAWQKWRVSLLISPSVARRQSGVSRVRPDPEDRPRKGSIESR